MNNFHLCELNLKSPYEKKQFLKLLLEEGIEASPGIDYAAGLYDEDGSLAAAGALCHNTLRSLAVSSRYRGEALMNRIVSALIEEACARGITRLFLYTKPMYLDVFSSLGFHKIAKVKDQVLFMEHTPGGFSAYLDRLSEKVQSFLSDSLPMSKEGILPSPKGLMAENEAAFKHSMMTGTFASKKDDKCLLGAVVMNANPFTLGHRYLIEQALSSCEKLLLFVVSDNGSLIPADVRLRLVKEGVKDLQNVLVLSTEDYLISRATFPSYFIKDADAVTRAQAMLDAEIFSMIAEKLHIKKRFVGTEPYSRITDCYNAVMKEILPKKDIQLFEIERLSISGKPAQYISASMVRKLLAEENFAEAEKYLPNTSLSYFTSEEAKPLLKKLASLDEAELIHA